MNDALIGYSGFVGRTLLRQRTFEHQYRSTNIAEIKGRAFGLTICAGAPAQKWLANQDPVADLAKLNRLISHLQTITSEQFVLISTVDVFSDPSGVCEDTPVDEASLSPYGLHRRQLEKFVTEHFENHLIVRLPGLVGPGLRKNIIYDFLNDNNLDKIDSRHSFQFYPMVHLWRDLQVLLKSKLDLIHLTAQPVTVANVASKGFERIFDNTLPGIPVAYDFQTIHAGLLGASGPYHYTAQESLLAIRAYAQSEARCMPPPPSPLQNSEIETK